MDGTSITSACVVKSLAVCEAFNGVLAVLTKGGILRHMGIFMWHYDDMRAFKGVYGVEIWIAWKGVQRMNDTTKALN